jgi:germination protein M
MTKFFRAKKPHKNMLLILFLAAVTLTIALLFFGLGQNIAPTPPPQPPVSPQPPAEVAVTLYFSDAQAMYLEPEQRIVARGDVPLAEVVIRELMKGRDGQGTGSPIPKGTRLLGISVTDGIAHVNFSSEFQTKHWGGTTGEAHTVFAITNSLAELPGIERVQFLLEGKPLETLGHMDLTQPIAPDVGLIKK